MAYHPANVKGGGEGREGGVRPGCDAASCRIQAGETYGTHYGRGPDEQVGLIGRTGTVVYRGVAVHVVELLREGGQKLESVVSAVHDVSR